MCLDAPSTPKKWEFPLVQTERQLNWLTQLSYSLNRGARCGIQLSRFRIHEWNSGWLAIRSTMDQSLFYSDLLEFHVVNCIVTWHYPGDLIGGWLLRFLKPRRQLQQSNPAFMPNFLDSQRNFPVLFRWLGILFLRQWEGTEVLFTSKEVMATQYYDDFAVLELLRILRIQYCKKRRKHQI